MLLGDTTSKSIIIVWNELWKKKFYYCLTVHTLLKVSLFFKWNFKTSILFGSNTLPVSVLFDMSSERYV